MGNIQCLKIQLGIHCSSDFAHTEVLWDISKRVKLLAKYRFHRIHDMAIEGNLTMVILLCNLVSWEHFVCVWKLY